MKEKKLAEYKKYTIPEVGRFLAGQDIKWDRGVVKIAENGETIRESAKIDYDAHEIDVGENSDFSFMHFSPFEFEMRYKGEFYDLGTEWMEHLARKDENFVAYNKSFLEQEKAKWESYKASFEMNEAREKVIKRNLDDIQAKMDKIDNLEKKLNNDREV